MDPFPPEKRMCHLTGFTKKCKALVGSGKCQGRWVWIEGRDANTGEQMRQYGCVDDFGPKLQIELGAQMRSMGAAIESFRNEMVVANERQLALQSSELLRHLSSDASDRPPILIEASK
jgi:hypothetical protein